MISAEQALFLFNLKYSTDSFDSWKWDRYLKDSLVLVHEGDLHLAHNLVLDWGGPHNMANFAKTIVSQNDLQWDDGKDLQSFIVNGSLTVDGVVLNADMDGGALLLVTGGLKARSLVGGGSEIRIQGPTLLSEAAFGHYNDGTIDFGGGLTVPIYLNRDHDMRVDGEKNIEFDFSTFRSGVAEETNSIEDGEEVEDDNGDAPLAASLLARLAPDIDDQATLREFLLQGKSVFRSADWRPEELTPEQWLARVRKRWQWLRKVPAALINDSHVDAALSQSGLAMRYVPATMQTEKRIKVALTKAPEAFWLLDEDLRDDPNATIAIRHGLYIGQFLPEEITPPMCEAAIAFDPENQIEIPAHLASPSIVLRLVMRGQNPNSSPTHWQMEKICAELPAYLDDADAVPLAKLHKIALKLPQRLKTPEVVSVLQRRLGEQ